MFISCKHFLLLISIFWCVGVLLVRHGVNFMHSTILSINHVSKQYRCVDGHDRIALSDVSLDIRTGEIFGLLGVNGAGKTTLSSLIATRYPVTSGDILWRGVSIYQQLVVYRQQIGFCPQKPNLDTKLTLEQNLYYSGLLYGMSEQQIKERIAQLSEQFGLASYLSSRVEELSGGYRQRFLIARSIVHNPRILLLDEPTVGLDPHIRRHLWAVIKQLKEGGMSVILTTHYLDEAEVLSDRVCILDKGKILVIDTPKNLVVGSSKQNLEEVFLVLIDSECAKTSECDFFDVHGQASK